jgi:hypothetical protein
VLAWPSWLSIEYPISPYGDPEMQGALLSVHVYHHAVGSPAVVCTAEGLVNGRRRSVPLELIRTSRPDVYLLKQRAPTAGTWMLVIALQEGAGSAATALVDLGSSGEVVRAQVPTQPGHPWPRSVSGAEVDSMLRARAQSVRIAGS